MSEVLDFLLSALSWILLVSGSIWCIVGAVGILRMPDFYARTHPATMIDTLGAALILAGLALQATHIQVVIKLAIIYWLILISSPTSAHALVKAAYAGGLRVRADGPTIGLPSKRERDAQAKRAKEGNE
ncbi:MAG: monovalent cation/H(+) antiporter subunit G [Planctomycetes bacterium]|nr:monovalent cation/H(+) antiporter subunit G [Planctomycetota bacterium]